MKAVGWILAGLLAVALFWLWTADVGAISMLKDKHAAIAKENELLQAAVKERQLRVAVLIAELDTMRAERDTAWAHVAPAETLYLGHRAQAASLSYRRKWRDMGVLPRDTTTGGGVVPAPGHP